MIPSATEIAYSIYGAWRLARLDRGGMAFFDQSIEGFWKSFFAAVIVAPAHILMLVILLPDLKITAGAGRIIVVESLIYVISWTAFPLVMYHLTQNMGRAAEYKGFVIASNWAQVIVVTLFLPVTAITDDGLLPGILGSLVWLTALCAILFYGWFISLVALRISGPAAFGVVALSFILGYMIDHFGIAMLR